MKNKFLYWNESPIKRIRVIENALKNDPFLYHKKKNVISSGFNDSNNEDGQNSNQELLFCQDENSKQINSLKNKIYTKSSTIENNTQNYLNYMMKEKKSNSINKVVPTEPGSSLINNYEINNNNQKQLNHFPYQESFTPNKYSYNNCNNIKLSNYRNNSIDRKYLNNNRFNLLNYNNNENELSLGIRMNPSNSYKSLYDNNNLNNTDNLNNIDNMNNNDNIRINNSFMERMPSFKGTTDITDNSYYDKISKQLILQMNKNYMDFNQNLINKRYSPNAGNKFFLKNNELAIPPGHISNPRYYNLGESRLRSNPIVNPGNRAPIFNRFNSHNHKLKSEFV